MEEMVSAIGALCFCVILYLFADYLLKNDKKDNKNTSEKKVLDFASFINLKIKYGKFLAVFAMIIIILKIIYILSKEFT
jgi:hypothetical protein